MMKYSILIMAFISMTIDSAMPCDKKNDNINAGSNIDNNNNEDNMQNTKIRIKINSKIFTATLLNNNSAKMFVELLPLTISMVELNGNEKYYDLPKGLPANPSNPGTIKNGDLMLYGSKTLVLFYKTFSTSYSYTKLGTINDVTGLASALGTDNVSIVFEK